MRVQRVFTTILALATVNPGWAAVRGEMAAYLGGTANIPKDARGTFDFSDLYGALKYKYQGGEFALPYKRITVLETGDKVGHRVGLGVALGATLLGLWALPIAFSHKERHFLTVGYTQDDGRPGALVFELPKANAWTVVRTLENRTGKRAVETKAERVIAAKDAPPLAPQAAVASPSAAQPAATPGANAVPAPKVVPPSTPPKTEDESSDTRVVRLPG
jgi:hypothetical protein